MKFKEMRFFWYDCRQTDAYDNMYFVINLINANVVQVNSLSSALKTAWLAYTLRRGQHKPFKNKTLEDKAYKLEGWPRSYQRWGVLQPDFYDLDSLGMTEEDVKKYMRNPYKIGYYINKMSFSGRNSDLKKVLLRKQDYYAAIDFRRSKKTHRK